MEGKDLKEIHSDFWRHSQLILEEITIRMRGLDMWKCEALKKFPFEVYICTIVQDIRSFVPNLDVNVL